MESLSGNQRRYNEVRLREIRWLRNQFGILTCAESRGGFSGGAADWGGDVHQKSSRTKTRQDPGKTAGRKERMAVKNQIIKIHACVPAFMRDVSYRCLARLPETEENQRRGGKMSRCEIFNSKQSKKKKKNDSKHYITFSQQLVLFIFKFPVS